MILIPKYSNVVELGGTLSIIHTRDGELIEDRFYSNIVTNIGKKWLAARMKDTVSGVHTIPAQMTHMALSGNSTVGTALVKPTPAATATVMDSSGTAPTYSEMTTRQALSTAGGSFASYDTSGSTNNSTANSIPTIATITYAATFAAGVNTGAIIEAGIFNASSNGTLLCLTSFDVVNKQANDSIAITWTVNIQ